MLASLPMPPSDVTGMIKLRRRGAIALARRDRRAWNELRAMVAMYFHDHPQVERVRVTSTGRVFAAIFGRGWAAPPRPREPEAPIPVLPSARPPRAFERGAAAARAGEPEHFCPYRRTAEFCAWHEGWRSVARETRSSGRG